MKVVFENIFEHIGYLLYAIAARGKALEDENVIHLHRIVESTWKEFSVKTDSGLW